MNHDARDTLRDALLRYLPNDTMLRQQIYNHTFPPGVINPDRCAFYIGCVCIVCKGVFKNTEEQRMQGWEFITKQIALCPACSKARK